MVGGGAEPAFPWGICWEWFDCGAVSCGGGVNEGAVRAKLSDGGGGGPEVRPFGGPERPGGGGGGGGAESAFMLAEGRWETGGNAFASSALSLSKTWVASFSSSQSISMPPGLVFGAYGAGRVEAGAGALAALGPAFRGGAETAGNDPRPAGCAFEACAAR